MNTLPKSESMTVCITARDVAQTATPTLDGILPHLLEKLTQHPWRRAGASILVERVEPYRTFIVQPHLLYRWNHHCAACRETEIAPFEFQAELYTPLSGT